MLDEYAFSYGFLMLCEHKDPIVRDFALRDVYKRQDYTCTKGCWSDDYLHVIAKYNYCI